MQEFNVGNRIIYDNGITRLKGYIREKIDDKYLVMFDSADISSITGKIINSDKLKYLQLDKCLEESKECDFIAKDQGEAIYACQACKLRKITNK